MDFILKRFHGVIAFVFYGVIILGVMYLFINLLPFVLTIGLATWIVFKGYKILKSFSTKKENVITPINDKEEEYTNGQIIDVEYKEVK